jgi:hypothetical protein
MKFREHRGSLAASMATVVALDGTRADLARHLRRILDPFFCFTDDDITVKPYAFDLRVGWDTHIVTVRGYGVAGFSDGDLLKR